MSTIEAQPHAVSEQTIETSTNAQSISCDNREEDETIQQITNDNNSESNTDQDSQQMNQPSSIRALSSGPIRVPGTYPPEWLPDQEADSCMACDSQFTLIKRRHHCRSCGKIFCADCCKQRAKLLYLDNKEARVCSNCYNLIDYTLLNTSADSRTNHQESSDANPLPSSSQPQAQDQSNTTAPKVHGVLKTAINQARDNDCNISSSSSSDQHSNKQVIFSDGIRPGTDLSEPYPYTSSTSRDSRLPPFALPRQNRTADSQGSAKKTKTNKSQEGSFKNITVCDELGYLPPIVINKDSPIACNDYSSTSSSNPLTNLIINQFKSTVGRRSIQSSMESRGCPLNGIVKFEEISGVVGQNDVITFLLLRDFHLKVKIIRKPYSLKSDRTDSNESDCAETNQGEASQGVISQDVDEFWCFASSGLYRLGQNEIVLVVDKDKDDSCIPRDVFKIYLTLHELALRRQTLENLGNLLFQDGLFNCRDTAGLLFVRPLSYHCLDDLILPDKLFLIAILLQRWEVPWSKVFPMRLLLRLGYKYRVYPYPIISYRMREPVYYEVGHTIISILGDFRNFRYSMTHVDGLKVMLNKTTRKVLVQLSQSNYQQFNKVLDSSNNEHVLAWSSCPAEEADGHLVSVQNDDGHYETVEFFKKSSDQNVSFHNLESGTILGASFVIFSGALKVNQSGQPAKISIVEDGLLIQIQSCTMSALKNAIHFMHHFDIDCENSQDPLTRVEIEWLPAEPNVTVE